MQIEKRGLNRPPARAAPFRGKRIWRKFHLGGFHQRGSICPVWFESWQGKFVEAKQLLSKAPRPQTNCWNCSSTVQCKLKLPINFETHPPTHSLTCWQRHKLSKRIFRPAIASTTGFSNHFSHQKNCHWASWLFHNILVIAAFTTKNRFSFLTSNMLQTAYSNQVT